MELSSLNKVRLIVLIKETNNIDEINNFFMNTKKFQSSTFDTNARRSLVEEQDFILELSGKIQELQNEIYCMNDIQEIFKMLTQYAVEIPTLPVNQCLSHLVRITVFCSDIVIDVIVHCHTAGALLSQTAENNCPYHRVVGFLVLSGQFIITHLLQFLEEC